ncbi:TetR family transcriptional regulator [Bifidobacterium gallicum]
MSSYQRREQLIRVGRSLFASKGFESVSVEEIAAHAKVSKPIVYEHFGGKEGLYAVIVDREMRSLTETLFDALSENGDAHPRQIVEHTTLALFTYIEEHSEGFQVLVRDSPSTADSQSSFYSLWGDVCLRVEEVLEQWFKRQHLPTKYVGHYAQMLVGMTVFTGQYWANQRSTLSREELAALTVNLAWHGLSRLEPKPSLIFDEDDDMALEVGGNTNQEDDGLEEIVSAVPSTARSGKVDARERKRMLKEAEKAQKEAKRAQLAAERAQQRAMLASAKAKEISEQLEATTAPTEEYKPTPDVPESERCAGDDAEPAAH